MPFDAGLCPTVAANLSALPAASCVNKIDQVQKIAFQLTQATPSFLFANTGAGSYALQASWTARLSASDATKIIVSPYLQNVVIPQNEVIEEANENNINGVPQFLGRNFVKVTGQIRNADPAVIQALRDQITVRSSQNAGVSTIWAYFFGRNKRVTGVKSGSNLAGIPIYNFSISDVGTEGIRKDNIFNFEFILLEGWSETAQTLVTTDFEPTALV